jgi:hypothetical protein
MIAMSPHTLPLEQSRKPQALWHQIHGNDDISAFRLVDDEFANLVITSVLAFDHSLGVKKVEYWGKGDVPATPYP